MAALSPGIAVIIGLLVIALGVRHAARLGALGRRLDRLTGPLGGSPVARALRAGWHLPAFFREQWRAIDDDTARQRAEAGTTSVPVLVILLTVAAALTLQEYLGGHDTYERLFPPDGSRYWELWGFAWWSGWRVAGYVLIPMAVIACLPGERLRDYHISPRGFVRHLWIYVVMFAAILPAVYLASQTASFRHTYPFYRLANRSTTDLALWEALYAAQFLSLEFFFRGFVLHGLRRAYISAVVAWYRLRDGGLA